MTAGRREGERRDWYQLRRLDRDHKAPSAPADSQELPTRSWTRYLTHGSHLGMKILPETSL